MRVANLEIDPKQGTLTLTDERGKTANYRRDARAVAGNVTHIRYDALSGWEFLRPLLDAETFPGELFVNEPFHGQPPPGPLPVLAMRPIPARYVRDEDNIR
jgi:hypothetical protein